RNTAARLRPRRCPTSSPDSLCSSPKESSMRERSLLFALAFVCVSAAAASAQAPPPPEGFAIDSAVVKSRCGSCHRSAHQGRMSRISYRRATPENWERTIKRMVALNHVPLSPEDARAILKYLADRQGLAPEELRPIAFEPERRTIDYEYKADETTANLCTSC